VDGINPDQSVLELRIERKTVPAPVLGVIDPFSLQRIHVHVHCFDKAVVRILEDKRYSGLVEQESKFFSVAPRESICRPLACGPGSTSELEPAEISPSRPSTEKALEQSRRGPGNSRRGGHIR
jgi:hypothetical protein